MSLYLGRAGKKTSEILDGAAVFSNVWNYSRSIPRFSSNFFGFYNYLIGINLNNNIKKNQLPNIKKVMSTEAYENLAHALETNNSGLGHIEEHIYVKMYGYKNKQDLYNDICIEKGLD